MHSHKQSSCYPLWQQSVKDITIIIMKSLLFPFAHSSLSRQPPPAHEPDPAIHRLPPEPAPTTPSHTRTVRNSNVHISHDISVSLQKEGDDSIRQGGNSTARKYTVRPYQAQIQVKVVESNASKREATSNRPFERPAENPIKKPILSSFAKKLTFDTQQLANYTPQRQMRDPSPLSSSSKKDRPEQVSLTTQGQAGELRSKLAELQSLNASLRMQYQIGREKLAAREAEMQTLHEDHQRLQAKYGQQEIVLRRYQQREQEFAENKAMADMFCQEIEQQQSLIATLKAQLLEAQPKLAAYDEMEQKWQNRLEQETSQLNQKCQQQTFQINRKWELQTALIKGKWQRQAAEMKEKWQRQVAQLNWRLQHETAQVNRKWQHETAQMNRNRQREIAQMNRKWQHETAQDNLKWQHETAQINRKWELRLKQENDAYQLLFETHQRDSARLKEQISILRTKNEQFSNEIAQSGRQRQFLEKTLVQSQRLLANSQGEIKQLQESQGTAHGKISLLQLQQEEMKQAYIQLQNELKLVQQANILNQQTITSITRQLEEERKLLQIERTKVAVAASQKQAIVRHLQASNRDLLESFEKTKHQKDSSLAQVAQLKQINTALGGELDSLRGQISGLTNTLTLHQQSIVRKDEEICSLDEEIAQMGKLAQQLQRQASERQQKLAQSLVELSAKEEGITRLCMVVSQLQAKVQERKKRIDELQLRMVNYQKVIGSYRESLEQLKAAHQTRWQQLKAFYQAQFADLQAQLKEFSDAENSKRNFRAFKKQQLAKQTTITTTTTTTNNILTMQQSLDPHAPAPPTP